MPWFFYCQARFTALSAEDGNRPGASQKFSGSFTTLVRIAVLGLAFTPGKGARPNMLFSVSLVHEAPAQYNTTATQWSKAPYTNKARKTGLN
jgi:hypothetical protein